MCYFADLFCLWAHRCKYGTKPGEKWKISSSRVVVSGWIQPGSWKLCSLKPWNLRPPWQRSNGGLATRAGVFYLCLSLLFRALPTDHTTGVFGAQAWLQVRWDNHLKLWHFYNAVSQGWNISKRKMETHTLGKHVEKSLDLSDFHIPLLK